MATIRKRGELQWQAEIRRKGWPAQRRTFSYRADAERWARDVEREMDHGVFVSRAEAEATTLHEALERYAREETPRKKGADRELARIKAWQATPLAKRSLASIRGADLAKYRDERRQEGKAEATIRIELMLISALYKKARTDWGMAGLPAPTKDMSLPSSSRARERRLQSDEEKYLLAGIAEAMRRSPAVELVQVALETGMRQGELLALEWKDVDLRRGVAHLDDTKSGDPRDVPLSPRAIAVLEGRPRPIRGGPVFGITQDRLIRAFQSACRKGQKAWEKDHPGEPLPHGFLERLKFHDLRHEAASRWAPHLAAQELAKMFGWRTIQMAMRYYHPTGETLAAKLAQASAP